MAANVGNRSSVLASSSLSCPWRICPGHQKIPGTRSPPSQVDILNPRNGAALPP